MRGLHASPARRAPGTVARLLAGGLAVAAAVAACAQDPVTPELNEYGIPVDTTNNMVLPVLFGLIAVTALLIGAAFLAYRMGRAKDALPKPDRRDTWWTCAGCGTLNTGDRDACFSCHLGRGAEAPGSPAGTPPGADQPKG